MQRLTSLVSSSSPSFPHVPSSRVSQFRLKRESRLLHRCRNRLSSMIRSERPDEFTSDDVALDTENKDQPRQYTIKRVDPRSFIFRHGTKRVEDYVYRPPSMLVWYTNWTFTHGFLTVFLSFLFAFLILVLGFAVLILIAGNATPECIRVSGENFGYNESEKFADAFALSWTTFTTVVSAVWEKTLWRSYFGHVDDARLNCTCCLSSLLQLSGVSNCGTVAVSFCCNKSLWHQMFSGLLF